MGAHGIQEIVYRFGDAPVPPPDHRSYEIRVTPNRVRVRVDSYGDPIAETERPLLAGEFDAIALALDRHGLRKKEPDRDDDCVGGSSRTVVVIGPEGERLRGIAYTCGGRTTGDLEGDLDAFGDAVRALVPGLPRLLA